MTKQIRKKLATILAASMLLTAMPQIAIAKDYTNHWASATITKWKDKGIIKGFEDGTFRPKEEVTRAQLASVIVRLFGLTETASSKVYTDVEEGKWYAADIAKVSSANIMYIEGEKFRPNTPVTREEAAYAMAQAYKITGKSNKDFKDEEKISDWAIDAVDALMAGGYVNGTPEGNFNPQATLTRAELITMIDNITSQVINVAGTYTQDVEGNLVVNTRDVVLKDMTIKGNLYLAEGIGDGDVYLEGITVEGEVFVEGGGENSIKSKHSKYYQSIKVSASNPVRVVIEGDAVKIEAYPGTNVTLTGNFTDVIVSPDVKMNIKEAKVETIIVAPAVAENTEAKAPIINIDKTATVNTVQADTAVEIQGKGAVENLLVNSEGVKIEQKPGNTVIDKDLTVNIGGKDEAVKPPANNSGNNGSSSEDDSSSSDGGSNSGGNEDNVPPASKYRISGKILYKGEPVEFANVVLVDRNTNEREGSVTDENGNYAFYLKPGKVYGVESWIEDEEGNGYHIYKRNIVADRNYDNFDLELIQRHVANIKVIDANGVAVREVEVRTIVNGKEDGRSYTDNNGDAIRYLWDEKATYGFNFYLNGELIHTISETIKVEEDMRVDLVIKLEMGLTKTITGKVVDELGNPVEGVEVRLHEIIPLDTYDYNTERIATVRTDSEGIYTFNIPDTKKFYQVEARYSDKEDNVYRTEHVNALMTNRYPLVLKQNYGVVFTVVDKNDIPIPNAEIRIEYNGGGYSQTSTGRDGKASLYSYYVKPGSHVLKVTVGNEVQVRLWNPVEGHYNYRETFKFDTIETSNKVVSVKVVGDSITIGNKPVMPYEVAVRGKNWSSYGVLQNGEVIVGIPGEMNTSNAEIEIYDEDGIHIHTMQIAELEDRINSVEVNLNELEKYSIQGQVYLDGEVTTGAAIKVLANGFDWTLHQVSEVASTQSGYEIENLVDDRYLIQTTYTTTSGAIYMNTTRVNAKNNFDIHLYPMISTDIKLVDENGDELPGVMIEISYEKFDENGRNLGHTWLVDYTNSRGVVKFEDGIPLPQDIRINVVGRDYGRYQIVGNNEATITSDNMTIEFVLRENK